MSWNAKMKTLFSICLVFCSSISARASINIEEFIFSLATDKILNGPYEDEVLWKLTKIEEALVLLARQNSSIRVVFKNEMEIKQTEQTYEGSIALWREHVDLVNSCYEDLSEICVQLSRDLTQRAGALAYRVAERELTSVNCAVMFLLQALERDGYNFREKSDDAPSYWMKKYIRYWEMVDVELAKYTNFQLTQELEVAELELEEVLSFRFKSKLMNNYDIQFSDIVTRVDAAGEYTMMACALWAQPAGEGAVNYASFHRLRFMGKRDNQRNVLAVEIEYDGKDSWLLFKPKRRKELCNKSNVVKTIFTSEHQRETSKMKQEANNIVASYNASKLKIELIQISQIRELSLQKLFSK